MLWRVGARVPGPTVPGVTLGDFTAITASLLGAGALLQASVAIYRPARPLLMQVVILEATFLFLAMLNIILWALIVSEIQARWPATLRHANHIGGVFMIAAGFLSVALRRV